MIKKELHVTEQSTSKTEKEVEGAFWPFGMCQVSLCIYEVKGGRLEDVFVDYYKVKHRGSRGQQGVFLSQQAIIRVRGQSLGKTTRKSDDGGVEDWHRVSFLFSRWLTA